MDPNLKPSIWQQFAASIDYPADTINACPDELWSASLWQTHDRSPVLAQFWYVAYHTLFWIDLYLTGTEDGFLPPPPFLLIDQYDGGPIPERVYTKAELLAYLADCRQKTKATIAAQTDETIQQRCEFSWGECSFLELLIYSLRHTHGHASQLNMLLGQNGIASPDYVTQVRNEPI